MAGEVEEAGVMLGDNESSVLHRPRAHLNMSIDWDLLPPMPSTFTFVYGFASRMAVFFSLGLLLYFCVIRRHLLAEPAKLRSSDASPAKDKDTRNMDS